MTAELKGEGQFIQRLTEVSGQMLEMAKAAVYLEANNVMSESQGLVPVHFGTLKRSGYVTLPDEKAMVEIGYGGPASEYAVVIHEDESIEHPEHQDQRGPYNCSGSAKYLETPLDKEKAVFTNNVGAIMKDMMASGDTSMPASTLPQDPNSGGGQ